MKIHFLSINFAKAVLVLLFFLALATLYEFPTLPASAQTGNTKVYLPVAAANLRNGEPVLLGVYPPDYLGDQSSINRNLKDLDAWSGKKTTLAALFLDFEDPNPGYNVRVPLELLWDNGYTGFVNLITRHNASAIAQGSEDDDIREVAAAFAYWAALARQSQEDRVVFLAPLPEANITQGNTYGGNPQAYISAFRRIRDIFNDEFAKQNVPADTASWVFAPNGWGEPGMPAFEAYYPGQDVVDVVAFSSYNWGYCVGWEYDEWQLGPELYKSYVDRMKSMAPGKPIFISQTASTTHYPYRGNHDYQKKSEWFVDVYRYLTGLDGVRAVLYFNLPGECNWVFFRSGDVYYDGYKQAVASSGFEYLSPPAMIEAFSQP